MDTQAGRSSHLPVWIAAIALIVICAAGISALMGWIPTSTSTPADAVPISRLDKSSAAPAGMAPAKVPTGAAARANTPAAPPRTAKCMQCGVIKSVRELAASGKGPSYEVTVIFDDGTSQMITEAALPPWQDGEPVKIVNGVIRSDA